MEKYLSSGLIKGVGPVTAKRLVEHFGLDTLDIIQFNPDRLTEVEGIGPAKAQLIASSFAEQKEIREVMIYLQSYGISTTYAIKIYKMYGANTIPYIKENPYRLAEDVVGIGFKIADKIARSMGVPYDSPYRIAAGTKYVLSQASSNGHTYLPQDELVMQAAQLLQVDSKLVELAISNLAVNQAIILEDMEDHRAVYLAPFYYAEMGVCRRLMDLAMADVDILEGDLEEDLKRIQKEQGIILAKQQREAVIKSLTNGVVVITGGPGTGKTTTINCIIKLLEDRGMAVELAAPTGRAAKRMTEATGREAKTIHRMLEYGFSDEGDFFQKDENDPLLVDAVIIDEMSMVDILLMNHLLKAILPGTRLIMVGDVDQLPSVGPGNVLRDIIQSGIITVVRLTEIFRQAQESMIILNAHRINRGEYPYLNVKEKDFFIDRKEEPERILDSLIDLTCRRLPKYGNYHPMRDIQILVPMKKGTIGVHNLNLELQKVLNPPSPQKKEKLNRDTLFRVGDKVMQIKNNYKTKWRRFAGGQEVEEGEGVFNGDMGYIKSIDEEEQTLTVLFDDDKEVVYDFSQLDELELAYAISIHKSQGSEFSVVLIPLAWGPPMLMTRNLLYTAVTRAKEMVVIVGRERTIAQMVENNYIDRRYSGLAHRLKKVLLMK